MGIQASRKNQRNTRKQDQDTVTVSGLARLEDLEGPDMDSYDKLLAWFVQMAEHDRCDIDKNVMYAEIKNACTKAKEKRIAMRQHSASVESYTSTDIQQKSTKSSEDFLDKSKLSVPTISRQTTFSDEDDFGNDFPSRLLAPPVNRQSTFSDEEDVADEKNSSSLSFPYESERDDRSRMVDPQDILLKRRRDFQRCGKFKNIISTSVGGFLDRSYQLDPESRKKSASIGVVRHPTFETEEDIYERNSNSSSDEIEESLLNDQLLDGNLHDILMSVEVLYNKK